jgi:hypothetical protein
LTLPSINLIAASKSNVSLVPIAGPDGTSLDVVASAVHYNNRLILPVASLDYAV